MNDTDSNNITNNNFRKPPIIRVYPNNNESFEENKDDSISDINDNKLLINLYSIIKKKHYDKRNYLYLQSR